MPTEGPPLTLLEAKTLALLSLGILFRPPSWNSTMCATNVVISGLKGRGFVSEIRLFKRGRNSPLVLKMTPKGAQALRSTWEWLLIQAPRQETFYERTDRQTREKHDGPGGETK